MYNSTQASLCLLVFGTFSVVGSGLVKPVVRIPHKPVCIDTPLPAGDQTDCAVYALDGLNSDISNAITYVTSNPSCNATSADDLTCPLCAVQYMQQGLCLPGR